MKTITAGNYPILPALLAAGILLLLSMAPLGLLRQQAWLYPLARQAAKLRLDLESSEMTVYETAHFRIKYSREDAAVVPMVAEAAEKAYGPVTASMGVPPGKVLVVVYPDRSGMRQAFGSAGGNAMGMYWGGAIQILSPRVWQRDGVTEAEFIRTGPMVHELTHLAFDYQTNGNYPRWFTEGLAQYEEYRINGYEWVTADNDLRSALYTDAQMEDAFDDLPNQALAYRQSLAAVRYIAAIKGETGLQQVIAALKHGQSFRTAVSGVLGMDYDAYSRAWRAWAAGHM